MGSESVLGFETTWFTRHALDQMKIRGVTEREVYAVLCKPTKTGLPTQPDRKRYRKNKSNYKAIDVVFEEWPEEKQLVVVTVIVIDLDRGKR
jgi:hypothetical protein